MSESPQPSQHPITSQEEADQVAYALETLPTEHHEIDPEIVSQVIETQHARLDAWYASQASEG